MAARGNDLWFGLGDKSLIRLDASSLRTTLSVAMPDRVLGIALSDGAAWTIQFRDDLVYRVDTTSGLCSSGGAVEGSPVAIAYGAASIWVATPGNRRIWRIDPTGNDRVTAYPVDIPHRCARRDGRRLGARWRARSPGATRPCGASAADDDPSRSSGGRDGLGGPGPLAHHPLTEVGPSCGRTGCRAISAPQARLFNAAGV